jgi:type IV fimbrial biogenesis protein FimT
MTGKRGLTGRLGLGPAHGLRGFTVIELMMAVVVLAVLLAVAIPSFQGAALGSQLRAQANELLASAYLARSEALKRNAVVTLCASSDGTSCTGSWHQGWIIRNGATVIEQHAAAPAGFRITGTTTLNFQPTGFGATQANLIVCRATPSVGSEERVLSIDFTGRASVSTTKNSICP